MALVEEPTEVEMAEALVARLVELVEVRMVGATAAVVMVA